MALARARETPPQRVAAMAVKKKPSVVVKKPAARLKKVKPEPGRSAEERPASLQWTSPPTKISCKSSIVHAAPVVANRQLTKEFPQRKLKGKQNSLGGVFPRSAFDIVAKRAAEAAPKFLQEKLGYAPSFVGDLSRLWSRWHTFCLSALADSQNPLTSDPCRGFGRYF